MEPQTAA